MHKVIELLDRLGNLTDGSRSRLHFALIMSIICVEITGVSYHLTFTLLELIGATFTAFFLAYWLMTLLFPLIVKVLDRLFPEKEKGRSYPGNNASLER